MTDEHKDDCIGEYSEEEKKAFHEQSTRLTTYVIDYLNKHKLGPNVVQGAIQSIMFNLLMNVYGDKGSLERAREVCEGNKSAILDSLSAEGWQ